MSQTHTLSPEQRELLKNPNVCPHDIYEVMSILYHAEKYSDEDIHVMKGAVLNNRYWGRYLDVISWIDDPRLLIPFLDDGQNLEFALSKLLYNAIDGVQFDKARILIDYGASIEASRNYTRASEMKRYEAKLREFSKPAVKSANKV